MNIKKFIINHKYLLLFISFMLVFFFVYGINIFNNNIWYDETYSMIVNRFSFTKIISFIIKDTAPPLFAISLKIFSSIFGSKLWVVRILPLSIFLFNYYLAFFPIRKIYNFKVSIIFSLLILTSQISSFAALEIRNYSFSFTFMLAAIVYYLLFNKENKNKYLFLYIIFSLLAAYSHNYCYIGILLFVIINIISSIIKKNKKILISSIIILILCLPWISIITSQSKDISNSFWITKPTMYTFISSIKFVLSNISIINYLLIILLLISLVICIIKKQENILLPIIISLGTLILFYIYSYFKTPMFIPKYITTMAGIIYLSLAIILSNNKYCYIVFLLLLVYPFYLNICNERLQNDDSSINEMINLVKDNGINTFYHEGEFSVGMSEYYFPDSVHYIKEGMPMVVKVPEIFGNIKYINSINNIDEDNFIILYQGRRDSYSIQAYDYCLKTNKHLNNYYTGSFNIAIFKGCKKELEN